ncbi:serine/threonine-protein kinase [Streptomyces sp. NPDC097610]|uniref:serine/threonine-protein kinase n=1 Tax=Streptomyces sp. NPDC097610 TaxID=3157227 RepID=UPI00331B0B40
MVGGERLVGRYELREVLGAGGMGVVHQAFDRRLGREVAVKVVDLSSASEAERVRFEREALAVGRLRSKHVVTVHDVGEDIVNGVRVGFLVMELLEGAPLNSVLTAGLPSVENVISWGRQMGRALRDAHTAGVVHRDVKPSNVIISPQGAATLVDFGIARLNSVSCETLTMPGTVVGTPAYMAPERLRGEASDERCDLYGLGCVLYELLTGQPPFGRGTVRAAGADPVPVRRMPPGVPVALEALVLDLLRADPANRPDAVEAERRLAAVRASRTAVDVRTAPVTAVWDAPTRTATRGAGGAVEPAMSSPSVTPPVPGATPEARESVAGRAALVGAAALWGQLVLFTALPGWWAAAVAAVLGGALAVCCAPPAQPQLRSGTVPLVAMCTTGAVSVYLVGWSPVPWWGVLTVTVLLSPVLVEVGELLGMVTARVTGGLPEDAGSAAGLVNAVAVVIMLLHGRHPVAVVLVGGVGIWLVTSLASAVPLRAVSRCTGRHR